MISAADFVKLLEEKDLIPPETVQELRALIEKSARTHKPMTAAMAARYLVDQGHLSRLLAQRLLAKAEAEGGSAGQRKRPDPMPLKPEEGREDTPRKEQGGPKKGDEADLPVAEVDEELGFADEESPKPQTPKSASAPPPPSFPPPGQGAASPGPGPSVPGGQAPGGQAPGGGPPTQPQVPAAHPGMGQPVGQSGTSPGALGGYSPSDPLAGLMDASVSESPGGPPAPMWKKRRNVWESPLLLLGGGGVLLLLFAAVALIWTLGREGGDALLAEANADYTAGSYTQAIHKYDTFLERFSSHPDVGVARVRRGMAVLRQAVDGAAPEEALQVAQDTLPEIKDEEEFRAEAEAELIALLPRLAESLAQRAYQRTDPHLVDASEEALALLNRYVPKDKRPTTRLADIEATLDAARRSIAKEDERTEALAEMTQLVEEGNSEDAYQVRRRLIKQYPSLASDEELQQVMATVSQAELEKVTWQPGERGEPVVQEESPGVPAAVMSAVLTPGEAPVPETARAFLYLSGLLYAVDAASGEVVWTRDVGSKALGAAQPYRPVPVSDSLDSDLILADWHDDALARVAAADGELRWKKPLGERFDTLPVVAGEEVIVATGSGNVVVSSAESGETKGALRIPGELSLPPVIDRRRQRWYQVAHHSNLFVIDAENRQGVQVVYLAHEPGTIRARPILIDPYLLVLEDRGEASRLRVLNIERGDEETPVLEVQQIAIPGSVTTSPAVFGSRVVIVTTSGELLVYELRGGAPEEPVTLVARGKAKELAANDREVPVRYPLFTQGDIYLADTQLTKYELQASAARMVPQWIAEERCRVIQPPTLLEQTVYLAARKPQWPGAVMTAINTADGAIRWQIRLGVGPEASAGAAKSSTTEGLPVTAAGDVFPIPAATEPPPQRIGRSGALGFPESAQPPGQLVYLGGETWISARQGDYRLRRTTLGDGGNQGGATSSEFRLPDPVGGPLLAFDRAVIVPTEVGRIYAIDTETGENRYQPLQLPVAPGERFLWSDALVTANREILLADREHGLYRVGFEERPSPHLVLRKRTVWDSPPVTRLTLLENLGFAVDATHTLHAFELPELETAASIPLEDRVVWGPVAAGDLVFLATDGGTLLAVDNKPQIRWQADLEANRPAGMPWRQGDVLLVCLAGGELLRLDAADGAVLARSPLPQRPCFGPLDWQGQVIVGLEDGRLVFLDGAELLSRRARPAPWTQTTARVRRQGTVPSTELRLQE